MSRPTQLPMSVQRLVQQIYDVEVEDVDGFLVTDRHTASALEGNPDAIATDEKLLVAESNGFVDMSLFLDAQLLQRLRDGNPMAQLHDGNLGDFWLLVEGVSHFVYLGWNAHHDRQVTLLELEMQAEVDKFVTALYLLRSQGQRGMARAVYRSLFGRVGFHDGLDSDRLSRYREANRFAGQYCRSIQQRFSSRRRRRGLLSELRRFYRYSQQRKMQHIAAAI